MKKMYVFCLLALCVATSKPILRPRERLKTPKEVIAEIKEFQDDFDRNFKLSIYNEPQKYLDLMKRGEELTAEALYAYMMCTLSESDGNPEEDPFVHEINRMQSWERDPSKHSKLKGTDDDKNFALYNERVDFIMDCLECKEYKPVLLKMIQELEGTVVYQKLHEDEARRHLKRHQEWHEKNQKKEELNNK